MFATRLLAICISTKPVVPDGPLTVKLRVFVDESKTRAETVELDETANTYWLL